jgi:hypothetical protein
VFVTLVALLSASFEDPLVPPVLFTIVGIGWVVLARSTAATPEKSRGDAADTSALGKLSR